MHGFGSGPKKPPLVQIRFAGITNYHSGTLLPRRTAGVTPRRHVDATAFYFMKRFATLLAILAPLAPALAQAPISAPASAKLNVKRDIPYAESSDPRQKVDIYAPE